VDSVGGLGIRCRGRIDGGLARGGFGVGEPRMGTRDGLVDRRGLDRGVLLDRFAVLGVAHGVCSSRGTCAAAQRA
jgi:hypothetical protein